MYSAIRPCGLTRLVGLKVTQPAFLIAGRPSSMIGGEQRRLGSSRPDKAAFEQRALELLRGFDKVDAGKVRDLSHSNLRMKKRSYSKIH